MQFQNRFVSSCAEWLPLATAAGVVPSCFLCSCSCVSYESAASAGQSAVRLGLSSWVLSFIISFEVFWRTGKVCMLRSDGHTTWVVQSLELKILCERATRGLLSSEPVYGLIRRLYCAALRLVSS